MAGREDTKETNNTGPVKKKKKDISNNRCRKCKRKGQNFVKCKECERQYHLECIQQATKGKIDLIDWSCHKCL